MNNGEIIIIMVTSSYNHAVSIFILSFYLCISFIHVSPSKEVELNTFVFGRESAHGLQGFPDSGHMDNCCQFGHTEK